MNIALIITVCEAYKARAINQFNNLIKHKDYLKKYNITPIFFTNEEPLSFDVSPFLTINFSNLKETYNNLYLKVLESLKYVNSNLQYDYVIKIDDDTLFNIDKFNLSLLTADYIGVPVTSLDENYIIIPRLKTQKKINLGMHEGQCFYMCGDFYILSKKAVEHVLNKTEKVKEIKEEFICEDYLIGYLLKDTPITTKNIKLKTTEAWQEMLQITQDYMSIHPIMDKDFDKLIKISFKDQITRLSTVSCTIGRAYRTTLVEKLQKDLIEVIRNFLNSQKNSGIC